MVDLQDENPSVMAQEDLIPELELIQLVEPVVLVVQLTAPEPCLEDLGVVAGLV